jgi:release factor glutamine methyltransferase
MELKLKVSPAVLIPRPETELLVETVLERLKDIPNPAVIDIGTGSGAIAIAIKHQLPDSQVTAVDISKTALSIAKENADDHRLSIRFLESDLFSSVTGTFDVLISNPPYIGIDEEIDPLVRNNEPPGALFAPMEGLYFYDQILKQAHTHLNPQFIIAMEIPENKDEQLKEFGKTYFPNAKMEILKDYAHRSRIMIITNQ